jgi:hypothetical protein
MGETISRLPAERVLGDYEFSRRRDYYLANWRDRELELEKLQEEYLACLASNTCYTEKERMKVALERAKSARFLNRLIIRSNHQWFYLMKIGGEERFSSRISLS